MGRVAVLMAEGYEEGPVPAPSSARHQPARQPREDC